MVGGRLRVDRKQERGGEARTEVRNEARVGGRCGGTARFERVEVEEAFCRIEQDLSPKRTPQELCRMLLEAVGK